MTNNNLILDSVCTTRNDPNRIDKLISKETNKAKYIAFGKIELKTKETVAINEKRGVAEREIIVDDENLDESEKERKILRVNEETVECIKRAP